MAKSEVPTNPATRRPMSSKIPKFSDAVNPIKDQIRGIISTGIGTCLSVKSNIPKVKIVVGQGNPNVGD